MALHTVTTEANRSTDDVPDNVAKLKAVLERATEDSATHSEDDPESGNSRRPYWHHEAYRHRGSRRFG
jgi:hypothetical protein